MKAHCILRGIVVALHVQSIELQLWLFPHATSSPTNPVEAHEYLHPEGRSALEKK